MVMMMMMMIDDDVHVDVDVDDVKDHAVDDDNASDIDNETMTIVRITEAAAMMWTVKMMIVTGWCVRKLWR